MLICISECLIYFHLFEKQIPVLELLSRVSISRSWAGSFEDRIEAPTQTLSSNDNRCACHVSLYLLNCATSALHFSLQNIEDYESREELEGILI